MWIKCPNGVPTIVNDPEHIKRLLSEGGIAMTEETLVTQDIVMQGKTRRRTSVKKVVVEDGSTELDE